MLFFQLTKRAWIFFGSGHVHNFFLLVGYYFQNQPPHLPQKSNNPPFISWLLFSFLSCLRRNTSYITSKKVRFRSALLQIVWFSLWDWKLPNKGRNELISEFCYLSYIKWDLFCSGLKRQTVWLWQEILGRDQQTCFYADGSSIWALEVFNFRRSK